tara:strand:+ start:1139 stop:1543 length:405 start_codon:yes stop_codon:yes gene_type:complete
MMPIPLTDLMQVTHPGYSAYALGKDMREVHYPMFFDYCLKVCDTFRHYAEKHSSNVITEQSLHQILDYVKDLNETDEPEDVFAIRNRLESACYAFEGHCRDMGRCFKSPDNMADYYESLGDLLTYTIHKYAGIV